MSEEQNDTFGFENGPDFQSINRLDVSCKLCTQVSAVNTVNIINRRWTFSSIVSLTPKIYTLFFVVVLGSV